MTQYARPATAARGIPPVASAITVKALLLSMLLAAGLLLAQPAPAAEPVQAQAPAAAKLPPIHVYKTPTCGCCGKWVEHMRAGGFTVEVTDMPDVSPVKAANGIPPKLASCHTALVGDYVVEGHVPVADVKRLLAEHPEVVGISVPQMPAGSPGMESSVAQPYDTLAIGKDGKVTVFAEHGR